MMPLQHTNRRGLTTISTAFSVVICFMVLCLSGCANPFASDPAVPTPTAVTPGATTSPAIPKLDMNGVTVESLNRDTVAKVQQIVAGMSLDQKMGQLIVVEYLGNSYQSSGLQTMISTLHVGGFMYQQSNHNFDAPNDQMNNVADFSRQANRDARIPLLIATDQEGGLVNRLAKFHGPLPSAQAMAATGNPHVAYAQGAQAARWMRELGINADLAPVVDVHTVTPAILETRMFGNNPQTVATYAGAFLQGLQENQVAACLKHFPGLGAVTSDPHFGLPTVNRSLTQLQNIDLAPYKLMIQKDHPAMIMSTDVLMPAIDPTLPAELSPKAITGILRKQLGYDGVVITDGLYMAGISQKWSLSQAAVLSIVAGNDLVEGPFTPQQVAGVDAALKQALQRGQLTMDQVNQSVARILLLKAQYGIIK
ncbi:MAG: glycoside hydrolase family 3 [Chloroflexota bacterium]|nr:glycoside hydrolase family 3 [Chloroflexota bacterium]